MRVRKSRPSSVLVTGISAQDPELVAAILLAQAAHDVRLVVVLRSRRPCEGKRKGNKADQHESLLFSGRFRSKLTFGPTLRVSSPDTRGAASAQATGTSAWAGAVVVPRTTLAAVQQFSREAAPREPRRDVLCWSARFLTRRRTARTPPELRARIGASPAQGRYVMGRTGCEDRGSVSSSVPVRSSRKASAISETKPHPMDETAGRARLGLVAEPSFPAIETHHDPVEVQTRRQVVDALTGLIAVALGPALGGWGPRPPGAVPRSAGGTGGAGELKASTVCEQVPGAPPFSRSAGSPTGARRSPPTLPSPSGRSRLGLVGNVGLRIAGEGERMALGDHPPLDVLAPDEAAHLRVCA